MDWRDLFVRHVPGFDYEHSPRFRALCRQQRAQMQERLRAMQHASEQDTMQLPAVTPSTKVVDIFETQPHTIITRHTEGIRPVRRVRTESVQ